MKTTMTARLIAAPLAAGLLAGAGATAANAAPAQTAAPAAPQQQAPALQASQTLPTGGIIAGAHTANHADYRLPLTAFTSFGLLSADQQHTVQYYVDGQPYGAPQSVGADGFSSIPVDLEPGTHFVSAVLSTDGAAVSGVNLQGFSVTAPLPGYDYPYEPTAQDYTLQTYPPYDPSVDPATIPGAV